MANVIPSFYVDGVHSPLSNFYAFEFVVSGKTYATVEHYFQAMKTVDLTEREKLRLTHGPGTVKKMGRRVQLRTDWEAIKLQVMRTALMHKFEINNPMGECLLGTGDAWLVEGNNWGDRFWGAVDGQGENWLGHLLMARRAELRALA